MLSTGVDNSAGPSGKRPRSPAPETRARVLAAARLAFCQVGFDHVGLREIARRADTDAAIIVRLFGSKEALFETVARDAFTFDMASQVGREGKGRAIADLLLGPPDPPADPLAFDAFQFLLRSAASPIAAPIVSAALQAGFVAPLADQIGVDEAQARAALVTACVIGVATMRFALKSPAFEDGEIEVLRRPFGAALQACLDR